MMLDALMSAAISAQRASTDDGQFQIEIVIEPEGLAVRGIALVEGMDVPRRTFRELTVVPWAMFQDRPSRLSVAVTHLCTHLNETVNAAKPSFPQPQRRDGSQPCGECRLPVGETCDICGAKAEQTYHGITLSELAQSGAYGWHPGDEA